MQIELVMLNFPKGKYITRVARTERFSFPCIIESLGTDFVSFLELAWRGSQMMEESLSMLKNRERKDIKLVTDYEKVVTMTPSFRQQQQ